LLKQDQELLNKAKAVFTKSFNGVIAIIVDNEATMIVDGSGPQPQLKYQPDFEPDKADCIWRIEEEALHRIFEGGRAIDSAFLSGRLTIQGDMAIMARLKLESPQ